MAFHDDDAVTPVVGTVLILLITMAGIGAVLTWGLPAVQGIQDQSNNAALQGEFSDIRLDTLRLSIVDTARTAFISLEDGDLAVENGSRFAIYSIHDHRFPDNSAHPDCIVKVGGWTTEGADTLTIEQDGCGNLDETPNTQELKPQLDKLVGSSVQSRPSITFTGGGSSIDITSAGDDLSQGDWRIQLIDSDDEVHAQVFILDTKRVAWHLRSSVSTIDMYIEGGALFQVEDPQIFNLAPARINEEIFVTGDYILEFPVYTASSEVLVSSPSDPQVFMQLQGSHGRVIGADTLRLRYDFSGDLSEAWCNHLVFRSSDITAGVYSEDADATCELGDSDGVRSVHYEPTASSFPFEFIQKRVYVALSV